MMSVPSGDFDYFYEEPIAVRPKSTDVDLSEFIAAGKVPWEDRAERIRKRFPTVDVLDWEDALARDVDLFGRIIRDILKLEQAVPGRPGPRPSLDVFAATRRMQHFWGNDFSLEPFPEALKLLAGQRSIRNLAHRVKLRKSYMNMLLNGQVEPDGFVMRLCAEAFDKHPSYFLEWRILYVVAAVVRRLEWSPEASVSLFRKLDVLYKTKNWT